MGRLLDPLEDAHVVGDRGAAHVEDAAELGVLHLHVAGGAHELHRRERVHRHPGRADRMALGLEPAGRVDRQRPALLGQALGHGARAPALRHQPHRLVLDQLGDGEAVVGLDEGKIGEREAGAGECARPGLAAAFELEHVAPRHRQEILHVLGGAERDRLAELERGRDVGKDERGGAVGDERAVRALERTGDARILLALGAAELVTKEIANLRERVADAVLVVLGGDARERVGLVAPALEIERSDLAENPGEAAVDVGLLAHVGSLEQVAADLGRGRRRHLLGTDHQHDARGPGGDRLEALVHRGRAGGAGILDPARALEAQIGRSLQHQRGGKILRREAGVEMAEHDLVDVARLDPGIGQRLARDPDDQALDRLAFEAPELRVRPAHDASRHGRPPVASLRRRLLGCRSDFRRLCRKRNTGAKAPNFGRFLPTLTADPRPGWSLRGVLALPFTRLRPKPCFSASGAVPRPAQTIGPEPVLLSTRFFVVRTLMWAALAGAATALPATRAAAEALLVIEAESGKVLYAERATQPWYPASVTKLMTAYVTLRAVKEGRLALDTPLTVSPNAVAQSPVKMGFGVGTV